MGPGFFVSLAGSDAISRPRSRDFCRFAFFRCERFCYGESCAKVSVDVVASLNDDVSHVTIY